jgi:putative hydrolase of the HAD superfamily
VAPDGRWAGIRCIALDGDDTLWHNEDAFHEAQESWRRLLAEYGAPQDLNRALLAIERRNLGVLGYGVKSFTLSMIETAIEVSGGRVGTEAIARMLDIGRGMLCAPVHLLPGARETVERLAAARRWRLLLITKGDMVHQERRIAGSGLGPLFEALEVVSEKDESTYRQVLERYRVDASGFLMVGNSIRSDALPVLAIGGSAAHVPYPLVWEHEAAERPLDSARFVELGALTEMCDRLGV